MYKQFSITIVSAMALSVIVALIFTPALCATMLKAHSHTSSKGVGARFSAWFEKHFSGLTNRYSGLVRFSTKRPLRMFGIYLIIVGVMVVLYQRTPTSFLPDEDQGTLFTIVQTPSGTTAENTEKVIKKVENYFLNLKRTMLRQCSQYAVSLLPDKGRIWV